MNIAYFLKPKSQVATIFDDMTVRQGLEKMEHHGYTAIPVVNRENKYVGTVSEGDFLWAVVDGNRELKHNFESMKMKDVMRIDKNPPSRIDATLEELVDKSMGQNFIPVIDDLGSFIGIVTRQDIIRYLHSCVEVHEKVRL